MSSRSLQFSTDSLERYGCTAVFSVDRSVRSGVSLVNEGISLCYCYVANVAKHCYGLGESTLVAYNTEMNASYLLSVNRFVNRSCPGGW